MTKDIIKSVRAVEILDSRGNPTLAVTVGLEDGTEALASVPSGASTGAHEAHEQRDGGPRFFGKGVLTAVHHVHQVLGPALVGLRASDQADCDHRLIDLDGTLQKSRYGANAILGVSLAIMKAASLSQRVPLYRYLGGAAARTLPVPLLNVLNGGAHADNNVDIQEFMVVPLGAGTFSDALRMASETYHALKELLTQKGLRTSVGDEGGFAPDLKDNRQALDLLMEAMHKVSLEPGKDMMLALDVAATELYQNGQYTVGGKVHTVDELVAFYEELVRDYPVVSIEDGLAEDDWSGWKTLRAELGSRVQLVGDDLFVTNSERIRQGLDQDVANAVLVKLNQVGTVSETLQAIRMTEQAGWRAVISHRSGETEDTSIADLAVATNAGQLKAGAPARGERVAKYNRLLMIEADDRGMEYAGWGAFQR